MIMIMIMNTNTKKIMIMISLKSSLNSVFLFNSRYVDHKSTQWKLSFVSGQLYLAYGRLHTTLFFLTSHKWTSENETEWDIKKNGKSEKKTNWKWMGHRKEWERRKKTNWKCMEYRKEWERLKKTNSYLHRLFISSILFGVCSDIV